MVDKTLQSYAVGANAAFINMLAILADELHKQFGLDKAAVISRVAAAADLITKEPVPSQPFQDLTTVRYLRLFADILEGKPKPRWIPVVVPGGSDS